ncbi:MAG: hypothetical protein EA427_07130 [Spirochaetaceae bacterium]|nr:MAG: hypothetical protein EA427_07130 [Spirochaetaceae bacterium]
MASRESAWRSRRLRRHPRRRRHGRLRRHPRHPRRRRRRFRCRSVRLPEAELPGAEETRHPLHAGAAPRVAQACPPRAWALSDGGVLP